MGKEIVYCGACGRSLLESEFAKGRAHTVDGRAFCRKCRPEEASSRSLPALPHKKATSTKLSTHGANIPTSLRLSALGRDSRKLLVVGGALAALAVVALIGYLAKGRGGPPSPPPPPGGSAQAPRVPVVPAIQVDFDEPILRDLERMASSAQDPEVILERCERARLTLIGTRHEARFRAIEEGARREKERRDQERELNALLEVAEGLRTGDSTFANEAQVKSLLQSALGIAGPRRAEVQRLISEYEAAARRARPAVRPTPPPQAQMAVVSFSLVDDKAQPIKGFDPIPADATLDLAALPTREVNLRANTSPPRVGSVVFGMDGNSQYHLENSFPYTIMGDSPYFSWRPAPGERTFAAVAYAEPMGAGAKGGEHRLTLRIVDGRAGAPAGPGSLLFSADFDAGPGRFEGGQCVPGGVNNSNALAVPPGGAVVRGAFSLTAREDTILRLRIKPLADLDRLTLQVWSEKRQDHARYFVPGLKRGCWRNIQVRAKELKFGPAQQGESLEGEILDHLKFQFAGPAAARILVDDLQIWAQAAPR